MLATKPLRHVAAAPAPGARRGPRPSTSADSITAAAWDRCACSGNPRSATVRNIPILFIPTRQESAGDGIVASRP